MTNFEAAKRLAMWAAKNQFSCAVYVWRHADGLYAHELCTPVAARVNAECMGRATQTVNGVVWQQLSA